MAEKIAKVCWPVGAVFGSAALTVLMFSPFDVAEGAFVFALPLLVWIVARRPRWKQFLPAAFFSCWLAWFGILIWLRFIYPPYGWVALVLLAVPLAALHLAWFAAARWALPLTLTDSWRWRLLAFAGLSSWWIILEWTRSWLFWGFPWTPLAASQWERPVMLQTASLGGAYLPSFILIFSNLAILSYGYRLFTRKAPATPKPLGLRLTLVPEFYLALTLIAWSFSLFISQIPDGSEELMSVGVVQPEVDPTLKWEADLAEQNLATLANLSRYVNASRDEIDLIVWPEAATPWPVLHDENMQMQRWMERFSRELGTAIFTGSIVYEGGLLFNAAILTKPRTGVSLDFYAKRRLVPFGEFEPLPWLGIGKVVPMSDTTPGEKGALMPLTTAGGQTIQLGPLICYEDIFPYLAREQSAAGADVLVVVTNDAWYGEEGGAYQHAAHSVLRAVETRRPVVRCGNNGWSGWINERGEVRAVLTDHEGSIYHQGFLAMTVARDPQWSQQQTFYTWAGNWAVWTGFVVAFFAGFYLKKRKKLSFL